MWNRITQAWCKTMHAQAMWPIHGKYTCPQCFREYPVTWEGLPSAAEYADPALRTDANRRELRHASASIDVCA